MATKRRKTTRRRSTRRRRLGALPVYPNAMGIMGTSAMLGPVTVGLGSAMSDSHHRLSEQLQHLSAMTAELSHELDSGQCGSVVSGIGHVARLIGRIEASSAGFTGVSSKIAAADRVLQKAYLMAPGACRR